MDWINVEDELPVESDDDYKVNVLLNTGEQYIEYYYHVGMNDDSGIYITHWCYLNPPKEQ